MLANLLSGIVVCLLAMFLYLGPGGSFSEKFSDYFLYWKHVDDNDNSQNWACHNYAHNLMRSAEPNAIFMTEGGDNQVFSLLYFSYVERKRPDVDFFDQKGNVFPRLYGDLMNPNNQLDLEIVRDLRDFELFSTGRPVYLTWKRPNLHRLSLAGFNATLDRIVKKWQENGRVNPNYANIAGYLEQKWRPAFNDVDSLRTAILKMVPKKTFNQKMKVGKNLKSQHLKYLGPWYFKTHGLLQKVTPIRYAIVDALETYKLLDLKNLKIYLKQISQIDFTDEEVRLYASEIEKEGYIRRVAGDVWQWIKPQKTAFEVYSEGDYWKNYSMDYTNQSNAKNWDYLTREIFGNYNFQQAQYHIRSRDIANIQAKRNPKEAKKYKDIAQVHFEKSKAVFERACYYGHDMPPMFFNYASILLKENLKDEAITHYLKAAKINRMMFQPHLNIGGIYMDKVRNGPVVEELANLTKAEENFKEAINRLQYSKLVENQLANLEKDQNYIRINNTLNKIKAEKEHPRAKVEKLKKKAKSNKVEDLLALVDIYEKRKDFQDAVNTLENVIKLSPFDFLHNDRKYNLLMKINQGQAMNHAQYMLRNWAQLKGANASRGLDLIKQLGYFYIGYADQLFNNGRREDAFNGYRQASFFLNDFKQKVMHLINSNPEIRRQVVDIDKRLRHVHGRLKLAEKAS